MRLLPILWAEPPTTEDWQRLSAARTALGYTDLIQPAEAVPGSPGPILAIGKMPDWIIQYAYVPSTRDSKLAERLQAVLDRQEDPDTIGKLLSRWMGVEVKQIGEEEYRGGVQFT